MMQNKTFLVTGTGALISLFLILFSTISLAQVYLFSVSTDKTTLKPGESYTLHIYYQVPSGTYYVYLNNLPIGSFNTQGESGHKSYNLTAPSIPGTYTFNVMLKNSLTGESDTKSYTITVVGSITFEWLLIFLLILLLLIVLGVIRLK